MELELGKMMVRAKIQVEDRAGGWRDLASREPQQGVPVLHRPKGMLPEKGFPGPKWLEKTGQKRLRSKLIQLDPTKSNQIRPIGLIGPIRPDPTRSKLNWPEIPAQKCLHSGLIQPDPTKSNHEGNAEGRIPGLPKSTSQLAPSLTINNQLPNHPPSSGPIRLNPTKSGQNRPEKPARNCLCSKMIQPNPTKSNLSQT